MAGPLVLSGEQAPILDAAISVMARRGYVESTESAIAEVAGIGEAELRRRVGDKAACMIALYEAFSGHLFEVVANEIDLEAPPPGFVEVAAAAYLGALEDNVVVARLTMFEIDHLGRSGRNLRRRSAARFGELFHHRHALERRIRPSLGELPDQTYLAILFATRELAAAVLDSDDPTPQLRPLAKTVGLWVRAMISGAQSEEFGAAHRP